MANNYIKGITVQIGGDTSGLQKSLKNVTTEVTGLNSKLRTVESALKLDPTNTELLSQKYRLLSEDVTATSDRLNQLKNLQQEFIKSGGDIDSKEYIELEKQIVLCQNSLKKIVSEQSSFNVQLEKLRINAKNLGGSY